MQYLSNVRYGYFDALRGFSMMLVVFHHVILISLGIENGINDFFYTFRMPMFFFVSGFFAYKPLDLWTKERLKDIVTRKFKVQIVGATIFLSLYLIFIFHTFPDFHSFLDPGGYWFTFVLFRIFIGYLTIVVISKLFRQSEKVFWVSIVSIAAICAGMYLCYDELIGFLQWSNQSKAVLYQLFYKRAICYFPYFTFGIFARANIGYFERFMSDTVVALILIISVVSFWTLISLDYIHFSLGNSVCFYPLGLLTLLLVVKLFYNKRQEFDKGTLLSKTIKLIGRRTLDIYFIHYFFLPDLAFLNPFLTVGNSVLMQLTIGGTISLLIIGISLLIGEVLRTSPALAEWLLGVKKQNRSKSIDQITEISGRPNN